MGRIVAKRALLYSGLVLLACAALMVPFFRKGHQPSNGNSAEQSRTARSDISKPDPVALLTPDAETIPEAKSQGWVVGNDQRLRDHAYDVTTRIQELRRLRGMELEKAIEKIQGEMHQLAEIIKAPRPATSRYVLFHGAVKPNSRSFYALHTSPADIVDPKEREEHARAIARNDEGRRIKAWLNEAETQYWLIRMLLEGVSERPQDDQRHYSA